MPILADLGIQAELLRIGLFDRLFLFLKYSGVFDLLQYALRTSPPFEKRLIRNDVDIVYFTTTSNWHLVLYKLPFIITIFDGCHRDTPEFDEVREFAEFERREVVFRSASTKAALVIANAPEIIDTLCRRYAMERDRAVCIPFSPSPYVSRSTANDDQDAAILQKYDLEPNYLFYPAQFWSHKNHATVSGGAGDVARPGTEVDTGAVRIGPRRASRGGGIRLHNTVLLIRSESSVSFPPPISARSIADATALVMASYFGPTNLPPLEAWAVGTPVIYPEAFKAQAGDAAILFDYDSPSSLADAIVKASSAQECVRLATAGKQRLGISRSRPRKGTTSSPSTCSG